MKFLDLWQVGRWPSAREDQEQAESQFPAVVADSKLNLWFPGDPIPTQGKRLLVGVATYSKLDLQLLDLLNQVLSQPDAIALAVDVFSTRNCRTMEDFDRYVPGIGEVYQTPVVGLWENGVLTDKAWGKAARDLIFQVCGLENALQY